MNLKFESAYEILSKFLKIEFKPKIKIYIDNKNSKINHQQD